MGTACRECGEFSGVYLHKDFVTDVAEKQILDNIEKCPWAMSQSGRMKQVHTVCVCACACACVQCVCVCACMVCVCVRGVCVCACAVCVCVCVQCVRVSDDQWST